MFIAVRNTHYNIQTVSKLLLKSVEKWEANQFHIKRRLIIAKTKLHQIIIVKSLILHPNQHPVFTANLRYDQYRHLV